MAEQISFEIRERCEDMAIVEGATLEQIAKSEGVAIATLKTWSSADKWVERRKEHLNAIKSIKQGTAELRKRMLAKAIGTLDPQDVYAVARIERASQLTDKAQPEAEQTPITREINTPEDAIAALYEAIQARVNLVLARPDRLDLKAVKDMKQSLELIDQMRSQFINSKDTDTSSKTLSPETLKKIREEVYGLA
jgi:DNA-binding transcriptional regulator YiaG